jgi:transposase
LKNTGRPPLYNEQQRQALKEHTENHPFDTVRAVNQASSVNACCKTTQRILYRLGVRKLPAKRKIRLTPTQAQRRLAFAQEWLPKADELKAIIFSDETTCQSDRIGGSQQVFTPIGNAAARYQPKRLQQYSNVRAPISAMAWAAISRNSRSELIIMRKSSPTAKGYNAAAYQYTLDQGLLPFFQNGDIFQHDNAPIHTAHITKAWLQDHGIEPIRWPASSPDLNPIEHVWKLLKEELWKAHGEQYRNLKDNQADREHFCRWIKEAWQQVNQETIIHIIDSLPHRLQAVVDAEGWHTRY